MTNVLVGEHASHSYHAGLREAWSKLGSFNASYVDGQLAAGAYADSYHTSRLNRLATWERSLNLLPVSKTGFWFLRRAQDAAWLIEERAEVDNWTLLLCGSKVAYAFGLNYSYGSVLKRGEVRFVLLPHPGAFNSIWKNDEEIEKLRGWIRHGLYGEPAPTQILS